MLMHTMPVHTIVHDQNVQINNLFLFTANGSPPHRVDLYFTNRSIISQATTNIAALVVGNWSKGSNLLLRNIGTITAINGVNSIPGGNGPGGNGGSGANAPGPGGNGLSGGNGGNATNAGIGGNAINVAGNNLYTIPIRFINQGTISHGKAGTTAAGGFGGGGGGGGGGWTQNVYGGEWGLGGAGTPNGVHGATHWQNIQYGYTPLAGGNGGGLEAPGANGANGAYAGGSGALGGSRGLSSGAPADGYSIYGVSLINLTNTGLITGATI